MKNPLKDDAKILQLVERILHSPLKKEDRIHAIQIVCFTAGMYDDIIQIVDNYKGTTRSRKLFDLMKKTLELQLDAINL